MKSNKVIVFCAMVVSCAVLFTACGSGNKTQEKTTGSDNTEIMEAIKDNTDTPGFGYSEKKLTEQLVKEGFDKDEIESAIESSHIDWTEQAMKLGKYHVDGSYYSKSELIETLVEYDDFTKEEAQQGVEKMDVDWKEEALKEARMLIEDIGYTSNNKNELKESLIDHGFTQEEADYAVQAAGL